MFCFCIFACLLLGALAGCSNDVASNPCDFPEGHCGLEGDAVEVGLDMPMAVSPAEAVGACSGGHVVEFSTAEMQGNDLWLLAVWAELAATEEGCLARVVRVVVWRKPQGAAWESRPFDEYDVKGQYLSEVAECQSLGAGKLGPDEYNTTAGYPRSWIDTTEIEAVRVVLLATEDCEPIPVAVGFSEMP